MFIRRNPDDGAYLITMEHRARCAGECGRWLEPGGLAWSYMAAPVDGNYVECGLCRYGEEPRVEPDKAREVAYCPILGRDMPVLAPGEFRFK